MSCHTLYLKDALNGKDEVLKYAQQYLDTCEKYSLSFKQMLQYAINNGLREPIYDLITNEFDFIHPTEWIVYKGTDVTYWADEPRIAGYPENIITSYYEMIEFIKNGFIDENNYHYAFYYWDNSEIHKQKVLEQIKQFFVDNPGGIIVFG